MATSQSLANGASLFNNPLLSDVKILQIYKGKVTEYHAHKAVLCLHSAWFRNAFTGNFKEATDKVIELHDDDPVAFETMLRFFYNPYLCDMNKNFEPATDADDLLRYIGIYKVADKYECGDLKYEAVDELSRCHVSSNDDQLDLEQWALIIKAHYSNCAQCKCSMGLAICKVLLARDDGGLLLRDSRCDDLAMEFPYFGLHMFCRARAQNRPLHPSNFPPKEISYDN